MRWFRSHIRLGSRLALFALAIQFALSFSHVHVYGAGVAIASAAASIAARSPGTTGPEKSVPAHRSDAPSDPGCAICGLIQLAATSAPATAPVLLVPTTAARSMVEARADITRPVGPPHRFQARAPPAV
jgi:hypothetical protein